MKQFIRDYFDILCFKKCYNDFSLGYALLLDFVVMLPVYIFMTILLFAK